MKKMIFRVICMGLLFTVSGCGSDKQKIEQLEKEVNVLKSGEAQKIQRIAQLEEEVNVLKKKVADAKAADKARKIKAAAEQDLTCQKWDKEAAAELDEGNFQKALELREKVVQQDGCDEALRAKNQYLAAYIYLEKLNDLDKAKDAYQKVIDNYASSKYVAKAKKKLDALQQTVACDEWSVEAEAEYNNGNFQKAVDLREKVVQQDGCDEALRAKNQYLAGYIYQKKLNNLDKAKDAYQKVIDNYASSKYVAKAKTKLDALQ